MNLLSRAVGCVFLLSILGSKGAPASEIEFPRLRTIEADSDVVWASDITLSDTRLAYRQEKGATEWEAAFSYASFDIDYRPFTEFDFFGFEESLHEDRFSGQVNLRHEIVERITLVGTAGIYDGYPDYRRVWIANRYRQKYDHPDFPRIPGYEEPDPKGWHALAGARWEYLPRAGFAELRLGFAFDQTAPGYEDSEDANGDFLLRRGRERLETKSLSVSSENVIGPRLRALNEFSFSETTARDMRFTYQGSLNLALGQRWVVRGYGGISTEEPTFDAHFLGATIEWEVIRRLLLSVTGRYYKDTGEIEDSLLTSSAAPGLESWETGLGLRYTWGQSSIKIYGAGFWTNYDPIDVGTAEFTYLYRDRNWGLAQIAYSVQF
jgi:hypothetical protein